MGSSIARPSICVDNFDDAVDVVVVGYGYAGAITAIEAARNGASVLVAEKSPVPGGISVCSYGAVRCAVSAEDALSYLRVTNAGRTRDDVLAALAHGMTEMEDYVRALGEASDAEVSATRGSPKQGANYPFDGWQTFYHTTIDRIPNFDARAMYPHINGAPGGPRLFRVLEDNLGGLDVTVSLGSPVERLITDETRREVRGVVIGGAGGERRIAARRGVVLACGGFEGNAEMREQFWENRPVLPAAARTNTGDGIAMAQDLGAQLWHMWHFHGSYGFRHPDPDYPYAIRLKRLPDWVPAGGQLAGNMVLPMSSDRSPPVAMVWILLDAQGRRFMNEYQPYTQDTTHRAMGQLNPLTQSFDRNPAMFICDENGRKAYPLGRPTSNDNGVWYDWSDDNLREIEMGILKRADTVEALARTLGRDPATVRASVDRWNAMVRTGEGDQDFGRLPGTMAAIDTPPFYGADVFSVVSNTQGGPVHDGRQAVLNIADEPIPRLFAAGEMGSAFGHLYMSGGNIAECLVTGRIAGRGAAGLAAWR